MTTDIAITTTVQVPLRRIADLMVSAIESGESRYWCNGVYFQSRDLDEDKIPAGANDTVWYDDPAVYQREDFKLAIHEDNEDGADTVHTVDLDGIKKGLALMAEKSRHHFADLLNDNDDAETADIFLQYVALGEVVYG